MTRLGEKGRRKVKRLVARDGSGCVWCGRRLSRRADDASVATLDHVIPWSQGGSRALANLVLACGDCNRRRGSRPAGEWLEACERDPGRHPDRLTVELAIERSAVSPRSRRDWWHQHEGESIHPEGVAA